MILNTKLTLFCFAGALTMGLVDLLRAIGGEGSATTLAFGVLYLSVALLQLSRRHVSKALVPAMQRVR